MKKDADKNLDRMQQKLNKQLRVDIEHARQTFLEQKEAK